jgi:divalent metal cation (Fe/Co/Zn/Cd) transporter
MGGGLRRALDGERVTRGSETNRSILVSLGANVAIAVVKLVGAHVTGSGSMLAEALH